MSRLGRRAGISIVLAAVVAVAAIVGLGWKPKQSVHLPQSACWGMLSKDDLKPLAGKNGTAVAKTTETVASVLKPGPKPPTFHDADCLVSWNRKDTLLYLDFGAISSADVQDSEELDRPSQAPDKLGPGITLLWQSSGVSLSFPCTGVTWPYLYSPDVQVFVGGGNAPAGYKLTGAGLAPESAMNAYASIALKVSKAIAKQLPCTNTLTFPQSAPSIKATPPS
jgi:hypothetical protein